MSSTKYAPYGLPRHFAGINNFLRKFILKKCEDGGENSEKQTHIKQTK